MTKARVASIEKKCKGCGETKPISEFHLAALNRDGFHTNCKPCRSAYMAGHYEKNSSRIKTRMVNYYYENQELAIERTSAYYYENKEACAKRHRKWRSENWERLRPLFLAYSNGKEAHIKRATPPWADMGMITEFYKKAAVLTTETGIKHHVDHIIPLRGKTVCGLHVQTNLQVLTEEENKSKHNKFNPENILDAA